MSAQGKQLGWDSWPGLYTSVYTCACLCICLCIYTFLYHIPINVIYRWQSEVIIICHGGRVYISALSTAMGPLEGGKRLFEVVRICAGLPSLEEKGAGN